MKEPMRKLRLLFVALVALAVAFSGASVAAASELKNGKADQASAQLQRPKHKKRQKRGPRGPRGPQGAQGPAGPTGPGGPPGAPGRGIPFAFALGTNSPTFPVFSLNGVTIEAGCPGGALDLIVRAGVADHNIVQVTAFDNNAEIWWGDSYPDAPINQRISMLAGGSPFGDYNGLLAVRTLFGNMTTVQWWAMASIYSSQGDCVGGGTVSIA